jgi:hypothetical protein
MAASEDAMIRATVSGSFRRHMNAISTAVQELADLRVKVLSPADPRVVDSFADFLFVASDRVRSVRLVQDRHIESIRASDFLWLVAPDGYVGQSASMEIGFAVAAGVQIFGRDLPRDLTLRQYVTRVQTPSEVLRSIRPAANAAQGFLIDPHASIEEAHTILERIGRSLPQRASSNDGSFPQPAYSACQELLGVFRPTGAPIN